jgi:hypothetical protein
MISPLLSAMMTDPGAVPSNACPPDCGDIEGGARYYKPGRLYICSPRLVSFLILIVL